MTPDQGTRDGQIIAGQLMSLMDGYLSTQLIYVAAELALADTLTGRTTTAADLARDLGIREPSLRRILRGLAAIGILAETPPDHFALTPMGELLRTDHPRSLHGAVLVRGRIYYQTMGALFDSLTKDRTPFQHIHGTRFFDYLEEHPEQGAVFQSSMSSRSRYEAEVVVESHSFSPYRRIVDVGGGDGTLLGRILTATPTAQGILFDRPGAVSRAVAHLGRVAVTDTWQVIEGDFFESVPPRADLYILSRVLHDWDDHDATTILVNCRQAMADNSTLILIEAPLPQWAVDQPAAIRMDLHMLALFEGGCERTISEYGKLLDAADLRLALTVPIPGAGIAIIEATTK